MFLFAFASSLLSTLVEIALLPNSVLFCILALMGDVLGRALEESSLFCSRRCRCIGRSVEAAYVRLDAVDAGFVINRREAC